VRGREREGEEEERKEKEERDRKIDAGQLNAEAPRSRAWSSG
jgi:hypothetical protein